ncbi:histone-lysine N-methyltransferase eggless isoform X1 [Cloeon dipterum]|uniref:histone-lysine N-methyltransferase eggless isoform X1 n=1 Tax=Cloeon dipterum TaxID=197152 RepID=UPI00322066CC
MTDRSKKNDSEIMEIVLSDDEDVTSAAPTARSISTETFRKPHTDLRSENNRPKTTTVKVVPVCAPSVMKVTPAPPPAKSSMAVDEDSEIELIEEVTVLRDSSDAESASKEKPKQVMKLPTVGKDDIVMFGEDEKQPGNKAIKEPEAAQSAETDPPPAEVRKTIKAKRRICCNVDCSRSYNEPMELSEADLLTKSFFDIKESNKICYVCKNCTKLVDLFRQKGLDMLQKGQPIIEAVQYLPNKDMVIIDDSDEEDDAYELEEDNRKVAVDCKMMDEVVADFKEKYKISLQEDKCIESISKFKEEIEDDFKEIDAMINACHKSLGESYNAIYKPWYPDTMCIGELDTEQQRDLVRPQVPVYPAPEDKKRKKAVAMKKVTQLQPQMQQARIMQQQALAKAQMPQPDVIAEITTNPINSSLTQYVPPKGPVQNHPIKIGDFVYAMKSGLYQEWIKAKVVDIGLKNSEQSYKVKFTKSTAPAKSMSGRQIAYYEAAKHQFEVGARVIAIFHNPEETGANRYLFYAGIVAECIKVTNNYRYLIFFDDGCTQYVSHDNVRLVCKRSGNIWDDCHPDIRDFIKTYLESYPERPMVRLGVNQKVKTEWNTRWWLTRVKEVDCSLVLVHFEADNRTEWIYRGSQRLAPLYYEMQKKQQQKNSKTAVRLHRGFAANPTRKNHPEIEYPRMLDDEDELSITFVDAHGVRQKVSRSVAKKSTVNRTIVSSNAPASTAVLPDRRETDGKMIAENMGPGKWTKVFAPHSCTFKCVQEDENSYKEGDRMSCNPMLIPLKQGWGREITTFRNTKMQVFYRGPCGRRLRNMQEVMRYLRVTKSNLCADLFSFETALKIENSFNVENPLFFIKDISYGSENVKIPCVNTINYNEYPTYVNYSTVRTPSAKTYIDPDPGFLVCCDCTDDCLDKSKCACHQLSVQEAAVITNKPDPNKVGYNFRRLILNGQQAAALFECNKNCACSRNCLNKVVQHKMKCQLQLFKTEKRGWGLRALNDIPCGTFLCIYAGQIMTEQEGNEEGKLCGDEYLAELDYIEVLTGAKEGYESDISDIDDADYDGSKGNEEESDDSNDVDLPGQAAEDKDFITSLSKIELKEGDEKMSLRKRKSRVTDDQSVGKDGPEKTGMHRGEVAAPKLKEKEKKNVRYLFDRSEDIYVMDAKSVGNLGRYFNHSCDPNVLVQNVFVDTHDLRFPWVSFFTSKYVPAGTELCWNYNYEIGSLPDRRLDCYCESANCRGRLL